MLGPQIENLPDPNSYNTTAAVFTFPATNDLTSTAYTDIQAVHPPLVIFPASGVARSETNYMRMREVIMTFNGASDNGPYRLSTALSLWQLSFGNVTNLPAQSKDICYPIYPTFIRNGTQVRIYVYMHVPLTDGATAELRSFFQFGYFDDEPSTPHNVTISVSADYQFPFDDHFASISIGPDKVTPYTAYSNQFIADRAGVSYTLIEVEVDQAKEARDEYSHAYAAEAMLSLIYLPAGSAANSKLNAYEKNGNLWASNHRTKTTRVPQWEHGNVGYTTLIEDMGRYNAPWSHADQSFNNVDVSAVQKDFRAIPLANPTDDLGDNVLGCWEYRDNKPRMLTSQSYQSNPTNWFNASDAETMFGRGGDPSLSISYEVIWHDCITKPSVDDPYQVCNVIIGGYVQDFNGSNYFPGNDENSLQDRRLIFVQYPHSSALEDLPSHVEEAKMSFGWRGTNGDADSRIHAHNAAQRIRGHVTTPPLYQIQQFAPFAIPAMVNIAPKLLTSGRVMWDQLARANVTTMGQTNDDLFPVVTAVPTTLQELTGMVVNQLFEYVKEEFNTYQDQDIDLVFAEYGLNALYTVNDLGIPQVLLQNVPELRRWLLGQRTGVLQTRGFGAVTSHGFKYKDFRLHQTHLPYFISFDGAGEHANNYGVKAVNYHY